MRLIRFASVLAFVSLAACGGSSENNADPTTTAPSVEETTTTPPTTIPPTTEASTTTSTTVPEPAYELYEQVDLPLLKDPGATAILGPDNPLTDATYAAGYRGGQANPPDLSVPFSSFWSISPYLTDDPATPANEARLFYRTSDSNGYEETLLSHLPFADDAFITVSDPATQLSYWVTPEELANIYAGTPSAAAPDGYSFAPYFFLMVVSGGQIVSFEQMWFVDA